MKLDCLAIGSPEQRIIPLYDFTDEDARELHVLVSSLASGVVERVEIHKEVFVDAIGGCELSLQRGASNLSAVCDVAVSGLEYQLMAEKWDSVAGLIEPFVGGVIGYQWLGGGAEDGGLLLSRTGGW